jgi:hypothetical protein
MSRSLDQTPVAKRLWQTNSWGVTLLWATANRVKASQMQLHSKKLLTTLWSHGSGSTWRSPTVILAVGRTNDRHSCARGASGGALFLRLCEVRKVSAWPVASRNPTCRDVEEQWFDA